MISIDQHRFRLGDRPKEAFMGGHPFPPISCEICSVDLRVDLSADENGKAVHQHCYVKRVTSLNSLPTVATMTD